MRSIKTFVPAILLATMALATFGSTSAVAEPTAVCSEEPTVVEGMERCPAVSHLEAKSTKKAKLLTLNIECDVSYLGMESSAKPVVYTGNFTYTNCTNKCKISEEKEAASLEILWTSHEKGTIVGKSLIHVECSESLNCTYSAATAKGSVTGALLATNEKGEISFVEQTLVKETGGILCPKEAAVDLEMELTSPLYLITLSVLEMDCLRTWFGTGGLYLSNPDGKTCQTFDILLTGNYELAWLLF